MKKSAFFVALCLVFVMITPIFCAEPQPGLADGGLAGGGLAGGGLAGGDGLTSDTFPPIGGDEPDGNLADGGGNGNLSGGEESPADTAPDSVGGGNEGASLGVWWVVLAVIVGVAAVAIVIAMLGGRGKR